MYVEYWAILCEIAHARLEAIDRGEKEVEPQYGAWLRESRATGQFANLSGCSWGFTEDINGRGGGISWTAWGGGRWGSAIFDAKELDNRRYMARDRTDSVRAAEGWPSMVEVTENTSAGFQGDHREIGGSGARNIDTGIQEIESYVGGPT